MTYNFSEQSFGSELNIADCMMAALNTACNILNSEIVLFKYILNGFSIFIDDQFSPLHLPHFHN